MDGTVIGDRDLFLCLAVEENRKVYRAYFSLINTTPLLLAPILGDGKGRVIGR